MFKFIISFLILPLLLTVNFAYSKPSVGDDLPSVGFAWTPSVFPIVHEDLAGAGTAFYIGEGKFVTNFHVVATDKQNSYEIRTFDKLNPYAKIIHLDAKNDLAVLKVAPEFMKTLEETMTPLTLSEAPDLNTNSYIQTIGINYRDYNVPTREHKLISSEYINKTVEPNGEIIFPNPNRSVFFPGKSGSPLLDEQNQVIGISCCIGENIGFAAPVAKLLALLKTPQLDCESNVECIKQEKQNLIKKANNGDLEAQYRLVFMYLASNSPVKNIKKGVKLLEDLALKEHVKAQYVLGVLKISVGNNFLLPLSYGLSLTENHTKKGIKNLEKIAEKGHIAAQLQLANRFYKGTGVFKSRDLTKAIKWYKKAAEGGNIQSQLKLANIYKTGDGVPQDSKQAAQWYKQAAEQGNLYAQSEIGDMYKTGDGVPKDLTKTVYWYKKAAEQGNSFQQKQVGDMYKNGDGVPQDSKQAFKWYKKAAEQKNNLLAWAAQKEVGDMYKNGEGVFQDSKQAAYWHNKADEQKKEYDLMIDKMNITYNKNKMRRIHNRAKKMRNISK